MPFHLMESLCKVEVWNKDSSRFEPNELYKGCYGFYHGSQNDTMIVAIGSFKDSTDWTYYKVFSSVGPSIHIGWDILAFPLVILQISALALGVGLWLSALTAKYRDLAFLTATIIQLWMYATPIIYPVSQIPEKWRWVSSLNPMEMPVVAIRDMFIGQNISPVGDFGISITMTLFILATGVLIFNKVEKTFVDTV